MATREDEYNLWLIVGLSIFASLAAGGAVVVYQKIRGIRNNNPGNIRLSSTKWQGMADAQTDGAFIQFVSPEYGIRAMARILNNYAASGYRTIRQVITRWAPPSENDTESYIRAVSSAVGVADNVPLDLRTQLNPLIKAIIRHENGLQPYSDDTINAGIALA